MTHTENLLKSIEPLKNIFNKYYDELFTIYSAYSKFDIETLDDYVKDIFYSSNRSFFTICSKESFNNLETEKNWNNSIVYSPLNDHSRPFMKKGDIVFCYRQGQFTDLKEALNMRGIYALGFVASEPKLLFPDKADHNKYGVAILFPFGMKEHLELRNIQLNPITISLTPYNGNRNDALQYIPENEYSKSLLEQICRKNPYLRKSIENTIGKNIEDKPLPDEIWNMNSKSSNTSYLKNFSQTIYYGVPGCGKSYSIENELRKLGITKTMEADCTKRVVFHPEYTNSDFVGQILPQSIDDGEKISYPFVAGPFTQILAKAYTHRNTPYALIIEEINRGNAAAIFGELFQLLDRLDKDEVEMSNEVSYQKNWSSYPVTNDNINKEIFAAYDKYKNDKDEKGESIFEPFIKKELFEKYKLNIGIRLPPNLSIFATMNTSDQNVFKLDNAFKRRWDLQLVPNEFGDENGELSSEEKLQRDAKVEDFDFTWNEFRMAINKVISNPENSFDSSSFSDKQLGCWFVKADNGKIKTEIFVHKVLEYLWDDVFIFEKTPIFKNSYQTFADLSNSVLKSKTTDIFSESFLHILSTQKTGNNEINSVTEETQAETLENQQSQDL